MTVFTQRCLPLTSNTREPGNIDDENYLGEAQRDQFDLLMRILVDAVRHGISPKEEISWDYDYVSLWSPKLRDTRGHRVNLWKCSSNTFTGVVRSKTYWYSRLPRSGRESVKKHAQTGRGRRFIKDILDTADGVLISLIFSFPEMFLSESYALSDRIANSVIMNCLHNYSRFQKKLKLLRKKVKHAMLNKIQVDVEEDWLRDLSFFVRPVQIFNKIAHRSSKEKMFRVAVFSQTRASGLAGKQQIQEAVSEFLETVTTPQTYEPDDLLIWCIDQVTSHLASELNYGPNSEFKTSMSTSACRESPRRLEGKFGYLKQLVRDTEMTIPPLRDGIPGTIGNFVWRESIEKLRLGDKEVTKVNVAAIRENAKARIVTSGSYWKDAALQPFSHISLNVIKTLPNLRSGLKAGRLGWRFIEKLRHSYGDMTEGNHSWVFEEDHVYLYSTDWEKATDNPTPEMAWALTGQLLQKMGFEPDTLEAIREYWVGPKQLYLNGKFVGTLVNGVPMGDPLTKTNLSLAHPVCDLYAKVSSEAKAAEEGNGDDVIAPCSNRKYPEEFSRCARMLGYKESPLDSAVTEDWGTYCEEWFHLPVSRANTCRTGMKSRKQELLPYLDVPKVRVMIATSKDREDFSSDPRGKVTLLGRDQEYSERMEGPAQAIFAIASAFQDVTLATVDRPEPLFLPQQVAGVGKPPPGWSVDSWMNILKRCTPWHKEYYLTIMDELNEGRNGISGYRGALKESNHFSKEMLVELYEIPADDPIKEHIAITADQWSLFPGNVLTKLVTLGYLIPESKMTKYYLFQERLEQLEQDTKRDLFEVVKSKMVGCDYDDLRAKEIVTKFKNTFKEHPHLLRSGRTENLYLYEAVQLLEKGNPLYVDLAPAIAQRFGKPIRPLTQYEEAGEELYEWFLATAYFILEGEEYQNPPTDILEDDPIIIQEVLNGGADVFFIATDDMKLVRLAANKSLAPVGRISTIDFLSAMLFYGEEHIAPLENELTNIMGAPVRIIPDRGSIDFKIESFHQNETGSFRARGIPWRSDVKKENMVKEPHYATLEELHHKTLADLDYPRKGLSWGYPDLINSGRRWMRNR